VDSYCVESRFQLSMLRLLDEDMLVVDILDDVYVAVLGVDLHDDGFDGGVTIHEYAFFCNILSVVCLCCRVEAFLPCKALGMMAIRNGGSYTVRESSMS
jgi:hypothetical protein